MSDLLTPSQRALVEQGRQQIESALRKERDTQNLLDLALSADPENRARHERLDRAVANARVVTDAAFDSLYESFLEFARREVAQEQAP